MGNQTHIIQEQILDIQLAHREHAFEIQNRLSAVYHSEVIKVLEEVCDQAAAPDRFIQIDELAIDLGDISALHLEADFKAKVRHHLAEALEARVPRIQRSRSPASETAGQPINSRRRPDAAATLQTDERLMTTSEYRLALLRHFLQTGTLPWWAAISGPSELDDALAGLIQKGSRKLSRWIQEAILDQSIRRRLIHQFPDPLIAGLIELLAPDHQLTIKGWGQDLNQIFQLARPVGVSPAWVRFHTWDAVWQALSRHNLTQKTLLQSVLAAVSTQSGLSEHDLIESLHVAVNLKTTGYEVFAGRLPQLIESRLREIKQEANKKAQLREAPGIDLHHSKKSPDGMRDRSAEKFPTPQTDRTAKKPGRAERKLSSPSEDFGLTEGAGEIPAVETPARKIPKDSDTINNIIHKNNTDTRYEAGPFQSSAPAAVPEYYVENAGLVILWPYLAHFFRTLTLLVNNAFVDDFAAMRAIHLLQHLVAGEEKTAEFLLPLNKVLCGWDLAKPVAKGIDITPTEKVESNNLLSAVIAHWKALKNTSIAGLQASFLQRMGVLTNQNNNWLLQVEGLTYDLLLNQLPWGISMINLSWMKKMLVVEWIPTT